MCGAWIYDGYGKIWRMRVETFKINKDISDMLISIFKIIIPIIALFFSVTVFAIDTSSEETTCKEIGFKEKTEAFGNCVLELYERKSKDRSALLTQQLKGDGTQNDQTCQRYGYIPDTSDYSDCRMKIDMAQKEAIQAQARYEAELRVYQQQLADAERARRRDLAMRQLQIGLGMMSGSRSNSTAVINTPPPPQPPITNQTIRLPSGQQLYCSTNTAAGYTSCR